MQRVEACKDLLASDLQNRWDWLETSNEESPLERFHLSIANNLCILETIVSASTSQYTERHLHPKLQQISNTIYFHSNAYHQNFKHIPRTINIYWIKFGQHFPHPLLWIMLIPLMVRSGPELISSTTNTHYTATPIKSIANHTWNFLTSALPPHLIPSNISQQN